MSEGAEAELPVQRSFQVPYPPRSSINCVYTSKNTDDDRHVDAALVFTHGAGGTLQSDAMANFTDGFSRQSNILCFKGNMNFKSRVKMFNEVIASQLHIQTPRCLGGRSMGARAAVMAATKITTHLVLVSYPLHTSSAVRDQILLDLPASIKVIFISGDRDEMCDLERLEEVQKRMRCKTWRIVVQNADHGMNVMPKAGTREVGKMTGDVVAMWLTTSDDSLREGKIAWDLDKEIAQWSGWSRGDVNRHTNVNVSGNTAERIHGGKRKRKSTDIHDPDESRVMKTRK